MAHEDDLRDEADGATAETARTPEHRSFGQSLIAGIKEVVVVAAMALTSAFVAATVAAPGAVEAAYWRDHLGEPPPEVAGQNVLLVVDESRSGWAITLAAAALRAPPWQSSTIPVPRVHPASFQRSRTRG